MNKKRLIFQLYPSYLLVTLLVLVAVSWHAASIMNHFFIERTRESLKTQGMLLRKQIIQLLNPLDEDAMDVLCKEVARDTSTRLTVVLANGRVVGDSLENPAKMDNHRNRPEIANALDREITSVIRYSATLRQQLMYLALPLEIGNEIRAVLRTAIPLTDIEAERRSIQWRIALAGILIAVLASGVCFYISSKISRPIEKMRQSAERFARGELNLRLIPPPTREMSGLAEAMNQMAGQLQSRIEDLRRQRNELEAVLSSMTEGVIAVDLNERILSMNPAAGEIFEKNPQKMQGRHIHELVRNNDFYHLVTTTVRTGMEAESDIVIYQNREQVLNTRSTALYDADGRRIGVLVVAHDVSQLRQLDNMRRDFVANVSHEIKTPLTAVKGFVETLIDSAADNPQEIQRFLGIIKKHVDRLGAIVEDLLSLARIEQPDHLRQLTVESHNLKRVISAALQAIQVNADAKAITFQVGCDDGLTADFDAALMEQALVNLLDNAVKFSPEKSKIIVSAVSEDHHISISIKDQGPGIHPKHHPRLFERFYRVDKARSRKLGGTGLGLAIVKHIALAHSGEVSIDSRPGEGSCFTLRIPRDLRKHGTDSIR